MVDGVEQAEQVISLGAFFEACEGEDGPDGGMSILAAIFAQSGRISANIPRILGQLVERWTERNRSPAPR